jgi:hypothetical protein
MRMDSKVHGRIFKNKDGSEIKEDEFIVFRPSDNAVPEMLVFYRNLLIGQGASKEQVDAVIALELRVGNWRKVHPDQCKVADVRPGELGCF